MSYALKQYAEYLKQWLENKQMLNNNINRNHTLKAEFARNNP